MMVPQARQLCQGQLRPLKAQISVVSQLGGLQAFIT